MKTITKTLKALAVMLLLTVAVKAQVPQKFNYQAIARNPSGAELTGQALGIRVSIVDGSPGGTVVYQETHTKTTNNFGLFNLEVGTGTVVTGTFASIGWGSGPKYIKTEIDPAGGTSYTVAGTSELISVPYAIYSGNSTNPGPTGPQGPTGANGGNGSDGAVGPTGPQGIQGPQGVQGVTGSQGPAGANGADGATGPAGAQGPAGPAGPQGPAGADGATGANGADGATGPAGAQGPAGANGATGANGADGATGPQGPAGANGATGANGADGATGPAGANGATGPAGANGATGAQGPAGAAGATGPAGPTGLLQNGNAAGDTPYWNGSAWVINGNVYNNGGNVGVGNSTPGSKLGVGGNAAVGSTYANNAAPANGLIVEGQAYFSASTPSFNGSTYGATNSRVYAERNSGFGANNSAIFGFRNGSSGAASGGTGWGSSQVDAGVKGYSYWGNTYTSGVYGSSYGDYAQSAGTSGSISAGTGTTVLGHLGYYDGTSFWGVYTPNATFLGGAVRIPTGATLGYVLTSDAAGNATWQPSGSGPAGPTGPAGPAGANGATGPAGANGADGATGPAGANGANGATGPAGPAGANGATGADGPTGPAGANGADGATGPAGPTGLLQAGDSAGDTPYWDGSAWVTTSSNVFNNGGNVGVGATAPGSKLTVSGNAVIGSGAYLTSAAPTNGLLIEGQTRVNAQTILATATARGAATSNVFVQRPGTSFGANQNGLYVHREGASGIANGGTNWSSSGVDAGVKAYSFWGNQYTASLYGGNFGDYANTAGVAGVIGGQSSVTVSGFLAYYDGTSNWGLYTPNNAYMTGIRIPTGATAGYVLTSDGAGNGTWQAGVAGPTGPAGPAGAVGATGPAGANGANGANGADGATGPQGDPGVAGPAGSAGPAGATGPTGPGGITGTTNYMAKFTSANTVGNSLMQDNGTSTSIGTWLPLSNTYMLTVSRQQLTANGDGQATIYGYRTRDTQNDGTAYSVNTGNSATAGYNFWGDVYTWGVAGYNYNDYNRCGGVMGAEQGGTYWGSLGYRSSGLLNYGVYGSSAYASGGGFLEDNSSAGIGGGFFGDMIGSVSRGTVIGTITKGDLFASYNLGDEYTSGKQIELVTVGDAKVPAYTATSTEVTVYKKGKATMVNGSAYIQFDNNYTSLLGDAPVVTVTPMGACNGVYIASVDKNGFTVKELNGGNSNVELAWISIGDRVDAKGTNVPTALTQGTFDGNMNNVLFDDSKKDASGLGTWWDGNTIKFGKIPANLSPAPKKEGSNN